MSLKEILFTLLIGNSTINSSECNLEGKTFNVDNYKRYSMEFYYADINNDNIKDYFVVSYDMNKNNKFDITAFYKVLEIEDLGEKEKLTVSKSAEVVICDHNEDGREDVVYYDKKNNGILSKSD